MLLDMEKVEILRKVQL